MGKEMEKQLGVIVSSGFVDACAKPTFPGLLRIPDPYSAKILAVSAGAR
jgi:hypothetical protein